MASPPPPTPTSSTGSKKPARELSSITNHLLLTKTLNALVNSTSNTPAPAPSSSSIKENVPNEQPNSMQIQQQKALNLRLAAALKPVDRDNVAALLNFYQSLANNNNSNLNLPSNGHSNNSSFVDSSSSSFINPTSHPNFTSPNPTNTTHSSRSGIHTAPHLPPSKQSQPQTATKRSSSESTSMTYLCRFRQRNRLIEVPSTCEYYQQHGLSHDHLKQLIIHEFHLQQIPKTTLIVQMWSEQYQDYIDIESFKRLPLDGRLQVLIEKDVNLIGELSSSSSLPSKSPTTPVSTTIAPGRSSTPIPLQTTPGGDDGQVTPATLKRAKDEEIPSKTNNSHVESSPQGHIKMERMYEEPVSTCPPMLSMDNQQRSHNGIPEYNPMYDLLPKPLDGIPIPRFPPHIAAFLNGNGDANQLNALVQALYQEIVKYELYPNADELRSIVSRLVERHPNSVSVIGSVELLVRKLYYKFCNERKKYPVELKRRQPNKRKRSMRNTGEDDLPSILHSGTAPVITSGHPLMGLGRNVNDLQHSSLDRLMHLWTGASSEYKDVESLQQQQPNSPQHTSSGSSSASSSPVSHPMSIDHHNQDETPTSKHPLNLSISTGVNTNQQHLMCTE